MIRPYRTFWTVFLALGLSGPALAGTLYRCVGGADDPTNYSNSPVPGMTCKAVSSYQAGSSKKSHAPVASEQAPAGGAPAGAASSERVMSASTPLPDSPLAASVAIPVANGASVITGEGSLHDRALIASAYANSASFSTMPATARQGLQPKVSHKTLYKYTDADGVVHLEDEIHKPRSVQAEIIDSHTQTCDDGVHCREVGYDVNGAYSYSNLIRSCFACGVLPGVNFGTMVLNRTAFAAEIAGAATTYGVDEGLVRAIIHAESNYNPNAISYKGARGLMQLMPATASRFGVQNSFSAADNIKGGVQYLSFLSRRYNGDVRLIAAAYNAGEANVDRYGGVPPFAETQRYVDRVGTLAERYRGAK